MLRFYYCAAASLADLSQMKRGAFSGSLFPFSSSHLVEDSFTPVTSEPRSRLARDSVAGPYPVGLRLGTLSLALGLYRYNTGQNTKSNKTSKSFVLAQCHANHLIVPPLTLCVRF